MLCACRPPACDARCAFCHPLWLCTRSGYHGISIKQRGEPMACSSIVQTEAPACGQSCKRRLLHAPDTLLLTTPCSGSIAGKIVPTCLLPPRAVADTSAFAEVRQHALRQCNSPHPRLDTLGPPNVAVHHTEPLLSTSARRMRRAISLYQLTYCYRGSRTQLSYPNNQGSTHITDLLCSALSCWWVSCCWCCCCLSPLWHFDGPVQQQVGHVPVPTAT